MAYLVSDDDVAVVTLNDDDMSDHVMTFQRVGEIVYLDLFHDFAEVKIGNPYDSFHIATEDFKSACEAIGI